MPTMSDRRLRLHEILCETLGSRNVYFQPPESIKMKYPAIVYELDDISNRYADDLVYLSSVRYSITVIDKDPDSGIIDKMLHLPMCVYDRGYKKDNLNHTVFRLIF